MGNGVRDLKVFRESTGRDLIIVSRVTPSAESACGGIIEDRRIGEVGAGIYGATDFDTINL
jgi:hypothetical protein